MRHFGCYLGKRQKNKSSVGYVVVRNDEIRSIDYLIAVKQNVYIDGARFHVAFVEPTKRTLDGLEG